MEIDYRKKLAAKGLTPEGIGKYRFAEMFGISTRQALKTLKSLRGSTGQFKSSKPETTEYVGDRCNITIPETTIHTLEQLIAHCKIDTKIWNCVRFVANKWQVGAKNADGNLVSKDLFQIKATFEKSKTMTVEAVKAEVEKLKVEAAGAIKKFNINKSIKYTGKGNALEISIADLHSGKLAWGKETLGPNYDKKIAAKLYENAFMDILNRTTVPLEKILLVLGHDLIHSDTRAGTTTKGTPLDNDSRFHANFLSVWDLVQKQVNTCLQVAPVEVMMVPGNHDELSVWHLGHSLEMFYSGNKNVKIDNSPACRKYWNFGCNLVMGTHGDGIKLKDLPLIMATEMPEMFAAATHREIHTGHLHQERLIELSGVRCRIMPSLSPADWWHAHAGYCGMIRGAQGFVWSKYDGLIEIKEHSIRAKAE